MPETCNKATTSSQCNAVKTETCFWSKAKKRGTRVVQSAVCAKFPEKCSEATKKKQCTKIETDKCTWVKQSKTCVPKPCSSYKRKQKQCVKNERCQWLTSGRKKECGDKELTDSPTTAPTGTEPTRPSSCTQSAPDDWDFESGWYIESETCKKIQNYPGPITLSECKQICTEDDCTFMNWLEGSLNFQDVNEDSCVTYHGTHCEYFYVDPWNENYKRVYNCTG